MNSYSFTLHGSPSGCPLGYVSTARSVKWQSHSSPSSPSPPAMAAAAEGFPCPLPLSACATASRSSSSLKWHACLYEKEGGASELPVRLSSDPQGSRNART